MQKNEIAERQRRGTLILSSRDYSLLRQNRRVLIQKYAAKKSAPAIRPGRFLF